MKLGQSDYLPQELVISTKFHEDRTNIVDFLLIIVTFSASCKVLQSPSVMFEIFLPMQSQMEWIQY